MEGWGARSYAGILIPNQSCLVDRKGRSGSQIAGQLSSTWLEGAPFTRLQESRLVEFHKPFYNIAHPKGLWYLFRLYIYLIISPSLHLGINHGWGRRKRSSQSAKWSMETSTQFCMEHYPRPNVTRSQFATASKRLIPGLLQNCSWWWASNVHCFLSLTMLDFSLESLFSSTASAQRKLWGFQVFQKALKRVTEDSMPMLFTKNFMRSWINHLSKKDRYLHQVAIKTVRSFRSFRFSKFSFAHTGHRSPSFRQWQAQIRLRSHFTANRDQWQPTIR